MQASGSWVINSNDSQTYHSQDSAILKKTSGTKPAHITNCIGKGKSSPQKPDPNWFLCPTGQKLCTSWNVEPQDKAPSPAG